MTDGCCQTTVDTAALQKYQCRVLVIVRLINVVSFTMIVISSFLSGSSSLLSGALDNFGDAMTYAVSFAVVIQITWRLMNPVRTL